MTRTGAGNRPQPGGRKPQEAAQGGDQGAPVEGQSKQGKQGKQGKPATRLTQAALSGKEPLNSFSQLAALLATRSTEPEKTDTPPPAETQESPPSS